MNYILAVVIVIILLFAYRGHSKGIAKEIASLVSVVLSLLGLALIIRIIGSYTADNVSGIVQAVIFLVVLAFLAQIFRLLFASIKVITKIPIIHGLDSFVGMLVGIAEGVLMVWALFIVIEKYDIAGYSAEWLTQIANDEILSYFYMKNPFARFFL